MQGKDWGWLCANSLRGLESSAPQLRECGGEGWAHQRNKAPLLEGQEGEKQDHHRNFFLWAWAGSQVAWHNLHEL